MNEYREKITIEVDKLKNGVGVSEGGVKTLPEKYNDCNKNLREMFKTVKDSHYAALQTLCRNNHIEQHPQKPTLISWEFLRMIGKTPGD